MKDWVDKLKWMREGGVDEARWEGQELVFAKLGTDPNRQHHEPAMKRDPELERRAMLLGATTRLAKV